MRKKNSCFAGKWVGVAMLAFLLCSLCLAGCGKEDSNKNNEATPGVTAEQQPAATQTPTVTPTSTPSPTPTVPFYKEAYETAGRSDVYRLPIVTPAAETSCNCIRVSGDYALFSITQSESGEESEDKPIRYSYALMRPLVSKEVKYLEPGFIAGVSVLFEDGSFLLEDWEKHVINLYDNTMAPVRSYSYESGLYLGSYVGEDDGKWYILVMDDNRETQYLAVPKDGGEAVIGEKPAKLDTASVDPKYPFGWESMFDGSYPATWYFRENDGERNGIAFPKSRLREKMECINGDILCGCGGIYSDEEPDIREFRLYDLAKKTVSEPIAESDLTEKIQLRADAILQSQAVLFYAQRARYSGEVLMWIPEETDTPITGFCDFSKDSPIDCLRNLVGELKENAGIVITPDLMADDQAQDDFAEIIYEIEFANNFFVARKTNPELFPEGTTIHPENMRNNTNGHYEFNPHVFSKFYVLEHGEARRQAVFNYVDALRAGEEWFECPDEETMWWCNGRLGHFFFPVAQPYTFVGIYKNGKGQIQYYDSKEVFQEKEREFEEMVTGIINDAVGDDYTDLEKTLALYEFLTEYCTYDYEMLEHSAEWMDRQGGYRALIEKKGICNEFACLYQYLLLQCGVDAEESGGPSVTFGQDSHAWVYVTIDGKGYLVDPTWGETTTREPILAYFLFTDELREKRDGFRASKFDVAGAGEDSRKKYSFEAVDKRFEPLWNGIYVAMDREAKRIYYHDYDGNLCAFDYGEQ
ncbi:MAG: transglutaminase domain-containing protein [Lachnospiraceae bacterium]|nr:transglutaminase domain-containing protein [Lachnospiraceae bacterium]